MLLETDVKYAGCTIWLEGENKRQLNSSKKAIERWFIRQIEEALFSTGAKHARSTKPTTDDTV